MKAALFIVHQLRVHSLVKVTSVIVVKADSVIAVQVDYVRWLRWIL